VQPTAGAAAVAAFQYERVAGARYCRVVFNDALLSRRVQRDRETAMAHQSRLPAGAYPLHVVQRGHRRERCFFNDDDCAQYLGWLAEALRESGCALHAYVLMPNHVHLLLTARDAASVSRLLLSVGRRYVQHVNGRCARGGTVWEGRHRSSLIASDDYLLACHRYIELNPVRAGIVRNPGDYRWSSYGGNALGRRDAALTPHGRYVALGPNDDLRRAAYRTLFDLCGGADDAIDEIRRSLDREEPVGGRFVVPGRPLLAM
jgi:putative transposase